MSCFCLSVPLARRSIVFTLIYIVITTVIGLPFSIYDTFFLEQKHGAPRLATPRLPSALTDACPKALHAVSVSIHKIETERVSWGL